QERHAAKEPVGKRRRGGLSPSLLEEGDDDRVQLAVESLDPCDRRVDELDGAHLPTLHEVRLRRRVEERQFVAHSRTLRRQGPQSPGTRRLSPGASKASAAFRKRVVLS